MSNLVSMHQTKMLQIKQKSFWRITKRRILANDTVYGVEALVRQRGVHKKQIRDKKHRR